MGLTTLHLTFLFAALLVLPATAKEKPNIIVIFTDDHGWADLGANGVDKHIRTPNVDRLADDGVRFPIGYVTAPQCTPSRGDCFPASIKAKSGWSTTASRCAAKSSRCPSV